MNDIEKEGREPVENRGLYTSPEELFSQEREFESLEKAEISPTLLGDIDDMLSDLESTDSIDSLREIDSSWQEIIEKNRAEGETTSYLEGKDLVRRVIFGIGGIIERRTERDSLNAKYKTARRAESAEIERRINELNIEDVRWQHDAAIFVLALSKSPEGKERLSRFWQDFEKVGGREARFLRTAVIGLVGTMRLIDQIGYRPYLPEPRQDAEGKVDLWVVPKGAHWQKGFIALQLKTSINGVRGLELRPIDEHFLEVIDRNPDMKREARAAHKLLTFLEKYGIMHNAPNKGIWVDLTGSREEEVVDSVTGEPRFDDFILRRHLAAAQELLGSYFERRRRDAA